MPLDNPFEWRQFEPEVILLCVRWYLRYALSYRDLEEMMRHRNMSVDHTTIIRWVQRYAPELDKRCRRLFKRTNEPYRIDETYVRVGLARYFDFYNTRRRHNALDRRTPDEVYFDQAGLALAA